MKNFFRKLNNRIVPTYDEVDKLIESLGPLKTRLEELRAALEMISNGNQNPKVRVQVQNLCEALRTTFIRDLGFVEEVEKEVEASSGGNSPSDSEIFNDLNGIIGDMVNLIIIILEKRNVFNHNRILWNDSIIDKEGFLNDLKRILIWLGGGVYYYDSGVVKRIIFVGSIDVVAGRIFNLFALDQLNGYNRADVQRELKSFIINLIQK
jgi:hypothetical protein